MPLFHKTLQDALHMLGKGDYKETLNILSKHAQDELREHTYIDYSLYEIRLYLKNYITHLTLAMNTLKNSKLETQDAEYVKENIGKAKENIEAFEAGVRSLLKREGDILE